MKQPPPVERVLETAIYVDDIGRSVDFYGEVLGLSPVFRDDRMAALDVGGQSLLLVFRRGATLSGAELPWGWIPPHDGEGPLHFALAVDLATLPEWEDRLNELDIEIDGRVAWPGGGKSIYFRDPDGHSVELVTRGTWPTF